ncbi:MAG: hypothetical protein CK427_16610 [Leptospira sp.]|nr:MAG: hypothetical protein CK427_16610 [Leptospira sp.]
MNKIVFMLFTFISFSLSAEEKFLCPIEYEQSYKLIDGINVLTLKSREENTFLYDHAELENSIRNFNSTKELENFLKHRQYDMVFNNPNFEIFPVLLNEKIGFIDKNRKFVIQPQFDLAYNFSEGFASVSMNNKWGFIDKTGKFVIQPQFDLASNFSEGLARIRIDGNYGYIKKPDCK